MKAGIAGFAPAYRSYVLGVLLAGYTLDSLDRSVLGMLLQPIKLEFRVTDAQLGLLGGLAFAAFYSTLGIPLGLWADRSSRTRVLGVSIALWTVTTALCGLAASFSLLLLARIGTAIGEAGGSPASQSLISSYFSADRRATVLGLFALGAPAGSMLGSVLGGWGNEVLGWRHTLVLAGLPGVLLVPLVLFTVAEPRVAAAAPAPAPAPVPVPVPLTRVVATLCSHRSFRHLGLACALHSAAIYSAATFNAPFLTRSHGWSSSNIGLLMAINSAFGILGALLGGVMADRLTRRHADQRWLMWVPAASCLALAPVEMTVYLSHATLMLIPAFMVSGLLSAVFFGPSLAATQALAGSRMRAVAASLLIFAKTLLGMGIGPLAIGALSDELASMAGADALRYAMLATALFNVWAAGQYLLAAGPFRADLAAVRRDSVADATVFLPIAS